MSADPITLGIGGAVLGGMMDKENPLRGAALGGLGGAVAGPAFSAVEAAPGMAGAVGNGVAGSAFGANAAGGMAAQGALGGGLSATAGGLSPMGLAGGASGIAPVGGGMAALGAEGGGMMGGLASNAPSAAGLLGGDKLAGKGLEMGAQMLMKNEQAKQGQPVMPGIAPAPMKPMFGQPSFMQSAPMFRPAIGGLPVNHPVAANPRMRG